MIADGVDPRTLDKTRRGGAHFAAAHGELPVLELLHSRGVDVDAEDLAGGAPLHHAAQGNHEGIVKFLVERGCWLDATDGDECTPLHYAARGGAAEAAARLCKAGAKASLRNTWDLTPAGATPSHRTAVAIFIRFRCFSTLCLHGQLLSSISSPRMTASASAAEALCGGHIAVCLALRRAGQLGEDELTARHKGCTLLHLAAGAGKEKSVAWLLEQRGVDVNACTDLESLSALQCAVIGGSAGVVKRLLAAGAKADQRCAAVENLLDAALL